MIETAESVAFVGRQPIYNQSLETVAFELLFRSSDINQSQIIDGEAATAELIMNCFAEIGLDRIVGALPAFINVPRRFLLERHAYGLPRDRVVLEILEDVVPEPAVLAAMRELRDDGYTIAIDDFVFREELLPMVDLADIVKVEFPAVTAEKLSEHVEILRHRNVRTLAEKVETHEDFDVCREIGFDYYQGYFFSKPKVIHGQRIPVNKLALLRLIVELQDQSVQLESVAQAVATEPSLSYKLMKFVNSSYCALNTKVDSIQHAVSLAGIQRIKTFCGLSLLSKAVEEKPSQIIQTALTRAKMCEQLVNRQGLRRISDQAFLVGLFSVMDVVLDKPLDEVLERISLAPEVVNALLRGEGAMGESLACVIEYERGNWQNVQCGELPAEAIRDTWLDAIDWSNKVATETAAY